MKLAFRVDASIAMGTGHVARCRALARRLQDFRATIQFICRAYPGHAVDAIRDDGFTVSTLSAPPGTDEMAALGAEAEIYTRRLGMSQQRDANETVRALTWQPDWLVVDHYALGAAWERRLQAHSGAILAIDDLANRDHDCDVLLDQNYVQDAQTRYRDRLPARARQLLGPRYALLRPEYAAYRETASARDGQIRRIMIFFGGTDPHNLTGRALEALDAPQFTALNVDVVIGANNPRHQALSEQVAARAGAQLYRSRPHLADLMAKADLALGAGGTTTWERCCLGLPSLVVSIADNQRPACEALAADGVIAYAGHWDTVTVNDLRVGIRRLIHDQARLRMMSVAARNTVDGAGTERVVDCLLHAP